MEEDMQNYKNRVSGAALTCLQSFIYSASREEEIQKPPNQKANKVGRPVDKTTREIVLELLYQGLSPQEIQIKTGKKLDTIRSAIFKIRREKNVRSVPELLVLRIKELEGYLEQWKKIKTSYRS